MGRGINCMYAPKKIHPATSRKYFIMGLDYTYIVQFKIVLRRCIPLYKVVYLS